MTTEDFLESLESKPGCKRFKDLEPGNSVYMFFPRLGKYEPMSINTMKVDKVFKSNGHLSIVLGHYCLHIPFNHLNACNLKIGAMNLYIGKQSFRKHCLQEMEKMISGRDDFNNPVLGVERILKNSRKKHES